MKLLFILLDILTNRRFRFLKVMLSGLFACLLITINNLLYFYFALWTPIFVDCGKEDIFRGDYEMNKEILVRNKTYAVAILGYGAVTSFIFVFIAMIRSLGKTYFVLIIDILILLFSRGELLRVYQS